MINANMPPAHANEKWENFDWDNLEEEPFKGDRSEETEPKKEYDFSEKDMEHLERLRAMVAEMHEKAEEIKAQNVDQVKLEQKREQARNLVPEWIEGGNKYIPEGRREEWAEHMSNLAEKDPDGAKERVEEVLDLMQELEDDRIQLADLKDRASDDQVKTIANHFRKFKMTSPLAGVDLGGVEVASNGERAYVALGEMKPKNAVLKATLSKKDRGVLEDLLLFSPQGLRVYREVWPARFWDERDQVNVERAMKRNAAEVAEARKTAVEPGELDDMIRARQKRRGGLALSRWSGTEQAKKRIAWIREMKGDGENIDLEPEDYWEQYFMDARGVEGDDIESTIEVLDALNNTRADVRKAVRLLDDYELKDTHRDFVRKRVLYLHPRGVDFYRESSQKGLTGAEKKILKYVEKQNEIVEPGVMKRLGKDKKDELDKEEAVETTPEERAKNDAARNAKSAQKERLMIGAETRNLKAAEAELAKARAELKKFGILDRINKNRVKYEAAVDNVRRAEYAVQVAKTNIAGRQEILERSLRGEM